MYLAERELLRKLEARTRELLCELEKSKERMLCELSGVDKVTLSRLRDIVSDFYTAKTAIAELATKTFKEFESELSASTGRAASGFENNINTIVENAEKSVDDVVERSVTEVIENSSGTIGEKVDEIVNEIKGDFTANLMQIMDDDVVVFKALLSEHATEVITSYKVQFENDLSFIADDFKNKLSDELRGNFLTDAIDVAVNDAIRALEIESVQQTPLFANSLEELNASGDTAKPYILPDGYIYAHMLKEQNVVHNANDGTGTLNARATASPGSTIADNTTKNGIFVTAAIPFDAAKNRVVNISGVDKLVPAFYASLYVYYFDKSGNYIKYLSNRGLGITTADEVEISLPITFDAISTLDTNYINTVGYIRIALCLHMSAAITSDTIKNLVVNVAQLDTKTTSRTWANTGLLFNTNNYGAAIDANTAAIAALSEEIDELAEKSETIPSNSGAVWYAVGDSITKGYGVGADNCWVAHVLKLNGYNPELSRNLGVSGIGFIKADPNYNKTARTLIDETDFSGVDLVTIAIGINDWKETYLSANMDDLAREMRYCFSKIMSDNPYCKIIFISPLNIAAKGSAAGNWALGYTGSDVTGGTLFAFIERQKAVCEDEGIQFIDLSKTSVINKHNITAVLYDTIHPDAECHKALAREIARKITYA